MDDRTRALQDQRLRLLNLTPEERVDAILSAPRPADLVRALPAQEFFLTVVVPGLDRTLALLPLASMRQLEFLFDIDAWDGDEFDPARAGYWLAAMREADPELIARWLREADEPLVVLTLLRLLHVYKNDESSDQAFWPPDEPIPTLDGIYYIEPREDFPEEAAAPLLQGLTRLRERDRAAYEALLEQVMWAVPPELEERTYEERASRLAEKGFPDVNEALEAWAPAPDHEMARIEQQLAHAPEPGPAPDAPLPLVLREPGLPMLATAARVLDLEGRERLAAHLVRLGNRFAVAGRQPLGEPETHRGGLLTALGMVELGLAEIAREDPRAASRAVQVLDVFAINRAGVRAVMARVRRATELAHGWISRVRFARERLDPSLLGVLDGLLRFRPAFVTAGGERSFRSPEDLAFVDRVLDVVGSIGDFLESRLGAGADHDLPELDPLPLFRESPADVDWSAVALTALARAALGEPPRPRPLASGTDGVRALDLLLEGAPPRTVAERFEGLCAEEGLAPAREYLAGILEQDAGDLPRGARPDPRFVRALLFGGADRA